MDYWTQVITAAAGVGGALIGAAGSLIGQLMILKSNQQTKEKADCNLIEAAILRGCLALPGNISVALGLNDEVRYVFGGNIKQATAQDAAKLERNLALLDDPLPFPTSELADIPERYYGALKHLTHARASINALRIYWSSDYLVAWSVQPKAERKIDVFPKDIVISHVRAMHYMVSESNLSKFSSLWSGEDLQRIADGISLNWDSCSVLPLLDEMQRITVVMQTNER